MATRASLVPFLEQSAYALLLMLALLFAFEPVRPAINLNGQLVLSLVEALLMLALGAWLLARSAARQWPTPPRALALPLVVWLLLLLASALVAPEYRSHAIKFVARVLNGVLVGWMAYDMSQHPTRWQRLVQALALSGALVGLLGLAETWAVEPFAGWLSYFKHGTTTVGDIVRISSTLTYPTITAMVLELTMPLLLAWAVTSTRGWQRLLLGALLVAGMATLLLTLSRAGVVALALALTAMAVTALWRWQIPGAGALVWGSGLAVGALALLTLVLFIANPLIRLRLLSETEGNWYQARFESRAIPPMEPSEIIQVPVLVQNMSVRDWHLHGPQPFLLGYHLLLEDGTMVQYDGARTLLEEAVPPGAVIEVQAYIIAPEEPGRYLIEWDMLQNEVAWFSWKGAPTLRVPLTVLGESDDELPILPPAPDIRIPAPTRGLLWRAAGQMVLERPLLGMGPDTFRLIYGRFVGLEQWDPNIHSNNLYIEWAATSGLLGLAAFLWWSRVLALALWQGIRAQSEHWVWRVALGAALLSWYLHGLLDYFFEFTPTYVAFWLIVGLLMRAVEPTSTEADAHSL
ncbi:MAG: O-antigen ligase family protein [Ardenticatenales bacterium]|nr:O-antigen ligase family protein [Ardenticatenales bacterium]